MPNPKQGGFAHGFCLTDYNPSHLSALLRSVQEVINSPAHVTQAELSGITTRQELNATVVGYIVSLDKQYRLKSTMTEMHDMITKWATENHVRVTHDSIKDHAEHGLDKTEADDRLRQLKADQMRAPIFTADAARYAPGSSSSSSSNRTQGVSAPAAESSSSVYERHMLPWHGYLFRSWYLQSSRTTLGNEMTGQVMTTTYHGQFQPLKVTCEDLTKAAMFIGAVKEAATVAYLYPHTENQSSSSYRGHEARFMTFVKTHKPVTKKTRAEFITSFNSVRPPAHSHLRAPALADDRFMVNVSKEGVLYPWPLVANIHVPQEVLSGAEGCDKFQASKSEGLQDWMVEKRAEQELVLTLVSSSTGSDSGVNSTALTLYDNTAAPTINTTTGAQACRALALLRNTSTSQVLSDVEEQLKAYQDNSQAMLTQYVKNRQQTEKAIVEEQKAVKAKAQALADEVRKRSTYSAQLADEHQALDVLVGQLKSVRQQNAANEQEREQRQLEHDKIDRRQRDEALGFAAWKNYKQEAEQALQHKLDDTKRELTTVMQELDRQKNNKRKAAAEREQDTRSVKLKTPTDDSLTERERTVAQRELEIVRRESTILQHEHQNREFARYNLQLTEERDGNLDTEQVQFVVRRVLDECITSIESTELYYYE
jgi:hypothetical protein